MKFEPKWYLPLNQLSFHPPEDNEGTSQSPSYPSHGTHHLLPLSLPISLLPSPLPSFLPSSSLYLPSRLAHPAHRPVPVTSDMELSVMKNKIAELKAQLGKGRERAVSQPDKEGLFVS